jgi:hypothetical protein
MLYIYRVKQKQLIMETMTTTAQNIANKLSQVEAINNATSYDMQIDAFNTMIELKRTLTGEAIDMTEEALENGDITIQENLKLNKMTRAIIMLDVKDKF